MTQNIPVSGIIITKNEEKYIARALKSLCWLDEILVVDANSEDKTVEICKDREARWAKKIRVISKPWEGFRKQRNFALDEAKHDWVFVVDADEECSNELSHKITSLWENDKTPPISGYKIKRVEYFLGKQIKYGIWNPSYQDRLFNKTGVRYINDIHEYPNFPPNPGRIHEPLLHRPDFHPQLFLEKMNKYTTIEAKERVEAGQRTNWFRLLFAFPAMFWKNYFYYKARKDGFHGFVISLLEGLSRVVRHVKIWQFTNELKNKK